jgi:hypothetical protein
MTAPIPDPRNDLASHQETLKAMKEAVETLAGQRGNKSVQAAATQADISAIKTSINEILIRLKAAGIT